MSNKENKMTAVELLIKVNQTATEEKKKLTKSFFGGDKKYFKSQLSKFMHCLVEGNVYETINNISSSYARSLDY